MKNDIFIQERNIMRVIAGSAKRLQLKTIDGLDTRPTTDRIKETLFNMIYMRLQIPVFWICSAEVEQSE